MFEPKFRESIPSDVREQVCDMFDGHCAYCGIEFKKVFHVDHVIPVAAGGPDDISNYLPSCPKCNMFKNSFSLEQFRTSLEEQTFKKCSFILAVRYGQITAHPKKIVFYFETLGHKFDEELVKAFMKSHALIQRD